jgi:hypothetical protein
VGVWALLVAICIVAFGAIGLSPTGNLTTPFNRVGTSIVLLLFGLLIAAGAVRRLLGSKQDAANPAHRSRRPR